MADGIARGSGAALALAHGGGAREIWGIFGGMGPLASAEFVKTIYEETEWATEQESPRIVLLSDPTMPDRTASVMSGGEDVLIARLEEGIRQLLAAGAARVIVCCLTIHPLLVHLTPAVRAKVVSLTDVIFACVERSGIRHLLICTEGTRKARLFENHPMWPATRDRIVVPSESDQRRIHDLLYMVKRQRHDRAALEWLDALLLDYGVTSYIAGCTESHVLAKEHARMTGRDRRQFCLDPLTALLPMIAGRTVNIP